jgi:tetratricopeptide (TPR) repeat protein
MQLLLARALISQSNANEALHLADLLVAKGDLQSRDRAAAALVAANAEYLLNRGAGIPYRTAAERALALSRETGDSSLVANALFELARAGVESGSEQLIANSARALEELIAVQVAGPCPPLAYYSRAFCEYYSHEPKAAAASINLAIRMLGASPDPSELSRFLTGAGLCWIDLCEHRAAEEALQQALSMVERIGDDSRASIISANMCLHRVIQGRFEEAVEFGIRSVRYSESALAQPVAGQAYLNLSGALLMTGDYESAALNQERARQWVAANRNWKANVEYFCHLAFAAMHAGKKQEALELVAKAERLALGRERAIAPAAGFYLLKLVNLCHLAGPIEALAHARAMRDRYRSSHPLLFLDAVAAVAWLEVTTDLSLSQETSEDLVMFDRLGANGRRRELAQDGFLSSVN